MVMKQSRPTPGAARALEVLEREGLLLLQDPALPSLAALVAGGPVRGSWWGHPRGGEIFLAARALQEHRDATAAKLVSGKITFVHRRLWPQLVAMGRSGEGWQMRGLPAEARALLARVEKEGRVRSSGRRATALAERLLVVCREVHTESGSHALELSTWDEFARRTELRSPPLSPEQARADLEEVLERLNREFGGRGRLPWSR
jgi:hypothetical protein